MKSKLSTHDIIVLIHELREKLLGLRVDQIYDIDKKSYLIRLSKTDTKRILLIESGCRFHTTTFEWPKNPAPSGFAMKLRKHLSNKRLESITQVGCDRVVDFQFGTEAFTFHIFLELYDKGNIILTDQHLNILSLVRPHGKGDDKVAPHEKYSIFRAKNSFSVSEEEMKLILEASPGKSLKEAFLSKIEFGPALFQFVLKENGLAQSLKIPAEQSSAEFSDLSNKLFAALEQGRLILESKSLEPGGFILLNLNPVKKAKPKAQGKNEEEENDSLNLEKKTVLIYDQFHPTLLASSYDSSQIISFPTLDEATDDFFSKVESQKIDLKQFKQQQEALYKLARVKEDQRKRVDELKKIQETDKRKAELIMFNQETVDQAIVILRQLIANQLSWSDISKQLDESKQNGDFLASHIESLNFKQNQFTMKLRDPYEDPEGDKGTSIVINLDLSAYANASKYFDLKKASGKKEERTIESQEKAIKSTEKKTLSTLREVETIQLIKKARKVFWFEKFRWFISSENYLVLAGLDAQQNELLVKKYLRPTDVYLHADSHGAPSVIIKNDNPTQPVLPKTLNEAGTLAVCASGAWETKIVPAVWWVWGHQVSKSAPTGEYLPSGSFMIRGKKNFLPPIQLVLGFAFLFRLSDQSLPNHANERTRRTHLNSTSSTLSDNHSGGDRGKEKEGEESKTEKIDDKVEEAIKEEGETDVFNEEEEDEEEFPDTEVQLGIQKSLRSRTFSTDSFSTVASSINSTGLFTTEQLEAAQNVSIITSGNLKNTEFDAAKLKKQQKKKDARKGQVGGSSGASSGKNKKVEKEKEVKEAQQPQTSSNTQKPKRGQHGRNKKLKEKYKFQDDEEREQRMSLLMSQGADSSVSKSETKPEPSSTSEIEEKLDKELKLDTTAPDLSSEQTKEEKHDKTNEKIKNHPKKESEKQETENAEEEQDQLPELEMNLLSTLTGNPLEEDELMFAVPVIAPYSTLQNYKFRIKMLPGSTKRGKAARSAVEIFIRDKQAKPREKDLLKSVKDQDLAKYFPGKVKLAGGTDQKK